MKIDSKWQNLIDVFIERNSKINLSAIRTQDEIYQKHILDALEIKNVIDLHEYWSCKACDVWTWWGFPLLPLAIEYKDIQRHGIDARKKKILAINSMVDTLLLKNCKNYHWRIEEHKNSYEIVTARSVAYSEKLLPRIDHILKPWWITVLYKLFTKDEDQYLEDHKRNVVKKHIYEQDTTKKCIYILKKPL